MPEVNEDADENSTEVCLYLLVDRVVRVRSDGGQCILHGKEHTSAVEQGGQMPKSKPCEDAAVVVVTVVHQHPTKRRFEAVVTQTHQG